MEQKQREIDNILIKYPVNNGVFPVRTKDSEDDLLLRIQRLEEKVTELENE